MYRSLSGVYWKPNERALIRYRLGTDWEPIGCKRKMTQNSEIKSAPLFSSARLSSGSLWAIRLRRFAFEKKVHQLAVQSLKNQSWRCYRGPVDLTGPIEPSGMCSRFHRDGSRFLIEFARFARFAHLWRSIRLIFSRSGFQNGACSSMWSNRSTNFKAKEISVKSVESS